MTETRNYALSGDDAFILDDVPITAFANGDNISITFPNDISSTIKGKNGNAAISKNPQGEIGEVTLRILRGTDDDRRLNSRLAAYRRDVATFPLFNGSFVKRIGRGDGTVVEDAYTLLGGVPQRKVDTKENQDGDSEQSISIYNLRFADIVPTKG